MPGRMLKHWPSPSISLRSRLFGEELPEDRVDVGNRGDAAHVEIPPLILDRQIGAPERGAVVRRAEDLALALIDDLDVGEILAKAHDLAIHQAQAALRIRGDIVTVR